MYFLDTGRGEYYKSKRIHEGRVQKNSWVLSPPLFTRPYKP